LLISRVVILLSEFEFTQKLDSREVNTS